MRSVYSRQGRFSGVFSYTVSWVPVPESNPRTLHRLFESLIHSWDGLPRRGKSDPLFLESTVDTPVLSSRR